MINCGERKIQKLGRVSLKDILSRHNISEGDIVEVYIKKSTIPQEVIQ